MKTYKHNESCRMSNVVATIVAIAGIVIALAMNIKAATWKVPARWAEATDSTRLTFYKNGSSFMTAKRTTPQSYDTTFTVSNDTFYTAEFRIYYAGVDSATNWVWERFTGTSGAGGASCAGDGNQSVRIFALDTSGADAAIQGTNLTIRNAAGGFIAALTTGSNGSATFNLDIASGVNRYGLYGSKVGYIFPNDTFSVTANIDSMAHEGYNVIISPPPSPNVCMVYGYVVDVTGAAMENAKVLFSLSRTVSDICDSTILGNFSVETSTDDSTGYFQQGLIYSACLLGSPQYQVIVTYKGQKARSKLFSVPSQATYKLEWWQ